MSNDTNSDVQTCLMAAAAGLWAAATHAFLREGKSGALAAMDKVSTGDAFVEMTVLFSKRGAAFEAEFCSHGGRSNLFTATLNSPSDAPAPTGLH